jgi:hypothetical protein
LGRSPIGAGTPTPSRPCARPWPRARMPRSPLGSIKIVASHRVALSTKTLAPELTAADAQP